VVYVQVNAERTGRVSSTNVYIFCDCGTVQIEMLFTKKHSRNSEDACHHLVRDLALPPPPNFPSENVNFKTDELGFNVMKGTINEGRSSRAM